MKKSDLIKFLEGLGFSKAQAEKLAKNTPEEGETLTADEQKIIADAFKASQKEVFENDTEFISKVKGEEKGKQLDIITRKLKSTFGLDAASIKDKPIEEIITLAKETITKNQEKSVTDIQNELLVANTKIKEYEEKIIPETKAEVENHKKAFKKEVNLSKFLAKQKLRVAEEAALPSLVTALEKKYDVDIDDEGNFVLFNKGQKTKATKEDKTGLLTFDEAAKTILEGFQFIEKSNGKTDPPKTNIQPEGGDKGEKKEKHYNHHLEAAHANLKEFQASKAAQK